MTVREKLQTSVTRIQWTFVDAINSVESALAERIDSGDGLKGHLLISPGIAVVSFLFVGLGLLFYYSILTFDPVDFVVYEYTLENWQNFLGLTRIHQIYYRTIKFSILNTVLSVVVAIPYSYLVIRVESSLVRRGLLFGLFIPFFTGVVVRTYGWMIVLGQNGLVNWLVQTAGFEPVNFIGTPIALSIGLLQYMLPFAVLMITPAIANIDRDLERAARNLGANRWETFRHVVLPLAVPGITAAVIVIFTLTMSMYAIPDLLGSGVLIFVSNLIYAKLFNTLNYPQAAVYSIVLIATTSVLVAVMFRLFGVGTLGIGEGEDS